MKNKKRKISLRLKEPKKTTGNTIYIVLSKKYMSVMSNKEYNHPSHLERWHIGVDDIYNFHSGDYKEYVEALIKENNGKLDYSGLVKDAISQKSELTNIRDKLEKIVRITSID